MGCKQGTWVGSEAGCEAENRYRERVALVRGCPRSVGVGPPWSEGPVGVLTQPNHEKRTREKLEKIVVQT